MLVSGARQHSVTSPRGFAHHQFHDGIRRESFGERRDRVRQIVSIEARFAVDYFGRHQRTQQRRGGARIDRYFGAPGQFQSLAGVLGGEMHRNISRDGCYGEHFQFVGGSQRR